MNLAARYCDRVILLQRRDHCERDTGRGADCGTDPVGIPCEHGDRKEERSAEYHVSWMDEVRRKDNWKMKTYAMRISCQRCTVERVFVNEFELK